MFQGGEERLRSGIVETRTDSAHRLPDAEFVSTEQGETGCGVGRTAVGMEYHVVDLAAAATPGSGDLDRVAGQLRIRVLTGRAGQQLAGEQIQHRREVELAFSCRNLGHVPHHLTFGAGALKSRLSRSWNFGAFLS